MLLSDYSSIHRYSDLVDVNSSETPAGRRRCGPSVRQSVSFRSFCRRGDMAEMSDPAACDLQKFRKSGDAAFYRRQMLGPRLQHRALLDSLRLSDKGAHLELLELNTQVQLLLSLSASQDDWVRITVEELQPLKSRYRVPDVVLEEPQCQQLRAKCHSQNSLVLSWSSGRHSVCVWSFPFRLEILCQQEVTVTFNAKGKLWLEALQDPPRAAAAAAVEPVEGETSCLWSETFKEFVDIKANGPSSVGADLCLHGFSNVFGAPQHADSLRLGDTRDGEPYRLYNLDTFAYPVHSRLGLYGSVPLLLAHNAQHTLGVFWLNASETFVNIRYDNLQGDTVPIVDRSNTEPQTGLHLLSESGIIDCVVLLGPSPQQLFSQYGQLTGFQALPPLFALGYHQSRWSYHDQADVEAVDSGFDRHRIPYDVIWLDIDHTDDKRYFTWDPRLFPDPVGLQRRLEKKKRKVVAISDPHIKVDPDWWLYREARDGGHFVKNRDGDVFLGLCWSGPSHYLDFTNPQTRAWYSSCFALDKYKGSTAALFVWNDMNEPSVFDGPEQTMPKHAVHHGGWEHRELHNLYGFYQHKATMEGLLSRSGGLERPFVLSRSFFAGSQRFGAVWTGDNTASWEHLKVTIPMLLSLSVAGISFCGADVGGFLKDPEVELLVRWYQAAALQPFFRNHSSKWSKRREPWLSGSGDSITAVRAAIEQRYSLLPYWYTLFHLAHTSGLPPIRPLWVEFPREEDTFAVEDQYMIGGALLACPVTAKGIREMEILLPGSAEVWYDISSSKAYKGGGTLSLPVNLLTVPVFQRGGSVVCRSTGSGSCSADFQQLPLTITVALNSQGASEGVLYLDDGHSFSYHQSKAFSLRRFTWSSGRLRCCSGNDEGRFDCGLVVGSVRVMGLEREPAAIRVLQSGHDDDAAAAFQHAESLHMLTVSSLDMKVTADWEMHLL